MVTKKTSQYRKKRNGFFSGLRRQELNHVLIRLIEDWRSHLDNLVGAILMDLSKAFDCIPHDLVATKLHAYALDEDALVFTYFYLKRRRLCGRINNRYSSFNRLYLMCLKVLYWSQSFLTFIQMIHFFIKQATLCNYSDDNILAYFSKTMPDLVYALEKESCLILVEAKRYDCQP